MNILVTAGNTQAPIDSVRCITNVFTGRTGAQIASAASQRGHAVLLLTSHPEAMAKLDGESTREPQCEVETYQTFSDLHRAMETHIRGGKWHAVVHSAAVSDYLCAGVYSGPEATSRAAMAHPMRTGKIKSNHDELWLRLTKAPKLVDLVRPAWGFRGLLVKFKLEVGVADAALLEIAERSRKQSHADLMVANTLEGAESWAYLGAEKYERVVRADLPSRLLDALERAQPE